MARRSNKSPSSSKQNPTLIEQPPAPIGEQTSPAHPHSPTPKSRSLLRSLADIRTQRALQLVLLAALYAPVSQMNLSPVYGAVPANLYHRYGLTLSFMLAFALRGQLPSWTSRAITPFCFWLPSVQFLLFRYSSTLGNPWGPVVTEALTCFPLVVLSVYTAMEYLDSVNLGGLNASYGDAVPSMGLFVFFTVFQRGCKSFIASIAAPGFLRSRIGLQLIIASIYGMVLPKSLIWASFPAAAVTMVGNPHCALLRTTQVLNNTLALYDYSLLERKESVTGYISVLEDNQRGFRVMRCDHSLLGGEWKMPPGKGTVRQVGEPIYAIFAMLEAVRLVDTSSPDAEKTALNIGLGVGTAPSAMIAHGVNTTVVEIDPVVHEFAVKYFDLPSNHRYYMGDAVAAASDIDSFPPDSYDYIIHDVFTGGAEPVELFTAEFLSGLHKLLKADGVIAINYAGDLAMPAASIVYTTVTSVFPSCRVFREDEAPAPGTKAEDFTNMVFFCRRRDIPVTFRKPVAADFLGSGARREFLTPKHEISPDVFDKSVRVLRSGKTKELETWQAQSAIGHWKVMRTVLPDAVWENW